MKNAIALSLLLVVLAQVAMLSGASGAFAPEAGAAAGPSSTQHCIATFFPSAETSFAMPRRVASAG